MNDCGLSGWSEALEIYAFSCLGVNDIDGFESSILIYPNPTSGILNVGFCLPAGQAEMLDEHRELELVLRDLVGRKILETIHPGKGIVKIHTSGIPEGMYILSLHARPGFTLSRRVVIQH